MNKYLQLSINYLASKGGTVSIDDLRQQDWVIDVSHVSKLTTGDNPYALIRGENLKLTDRGIKSISPELKKGIERKLKIKSAKRVAAKDYGEQHYYVGNTNVIDYAIRKGKNYLSNGPTGCGKTTMIDFMALKYKKRVRVIPCDVEIDTSNIVGKMKVKEGDTVFVYGELVKAMINGDWVVFDEINTTRPEVLTRVNPVLDHRRFISVIENEGEVIKANKGFRVFATMNPNYAGTEELNEALRGRFGVVQDVTYLSKEKETKLIVDRTGVKEDTASRLCDIARVLRSMRESDRIYHDIGTRHLLETAEAITDGFSPVEAARFGMNVTDDKEEKHDIINVVRNQFKE